MDASLSRRLWITAGGTVLTVVAALLAAFVVNLSPRSSAPPPASKGGLVVTAASVQPGPLDPARPLRCFVGAQMIGEMTVADCTQRGGVATDDPDPAVQVPAPPSAPAQPVDVVSDQPAPLQPLAQADSSAPPAASGVGDCRVSVDGEWRMLGAGMSLQGCATLLFDGQCLRGPGVVYGRWGAQTLRQQAGEIDISPDGRDFRPLAQQAPPGCRLQTF